MASTRWWWYSILILPLLTLQAPKMIAQDSRVRRMTSSTMRHEGGQLGSWWRGPHSSGSCATSSPGKWETLRCTLKGHRLFVLWREIWSITCDLFESQLDQVRRQMTWMALQEHGSSLSETVTVEMMSATVGALLSAQYTSWEFSVVVWNVFCIILGNATMLYIYIYIKCQCTDRMDSEM